MSYNKFCKVCSDAGKPQAVITSHSVKDVRDGKLVCPTLSCTKCRNCNKFGHTVKYCLETTTQHRKEKERMKEDFKEKEKEKTVQKKDLKVSTSANRFDVLSSSDDDDCPPPPMLKRNDPKPIRWIDYDSDSDSDIDYTSMSF
jgi:hypothetical protein